MKTIRASVDLPPLADASTSKGAKYLVPIVSAASWPEAVLTTLVYVYGFGLDDRVLRVTRVHTRARTPKRPPRASLARSSTRHTHMVPHNVEVEGAPRVSPP